MQEKWLFAICIYKLWFKNTGFWFVHEMLKGAFIKKFQSKVINLLRKTTIIGCCKSRHKF